MALFRLGPQPSPAHPLRNIFYTTVISLALGVVIWKLVHVDNPDQEGIRVYPSRPPGPYDVDTPVPPRRKSRRHRPSATRFEPETRVLGSSAVNGSASSGPVFDAETGALLRGSLPVPFDGQEHSNGNEMHGDGNSTPGTNTRVKEKEKSGAARLRQLMAASQTGPDSDEWVQYN